MCVLFSLSHLVTLSWSEVQQGGANMVKFVLPMKPLLGQGVVLHHFTRQQAGMDHATNSKKHIQDKPALIY